MENPVAILFLETKKGSPAYKKGKILHVKECLNNHNGSAGMMEIVRNGSYISAFIKSSFCEIYILHRGWRFKTFSSITASNPYGEDITVCKIECVGHVQRMGTRLRKIKQMSSKLSDGKSMGGKGKVDRQNDRLNYNVLWKCNPTK
ncbi:hypothetical protein TNCV_2772031 [Trichonephila clavipes]|nr:hypothetical protein TNCV_2772031 [Trichonephila clavipes]